MSFGSVAGYNGSTGVDSVVLGGSGEKYILVYNNLAASKVLSNGDVVNVSFAKDSGTGYFPVPVQPVTDSVGTTIVGVVQNSLLGLSTIANAAWGYVQIEGYCEAITDDAGAVTAGHTVCALNGAYTAHDEAGTTLTAKSFAIATAAGAATTGAQFPGYMLGFRVQV